MLRYFTGFLLQKNANKSAEKQIEPDSKDKQELWK